MSSKFYVTTPIYYASGKPHVGHTFTTLYADVIARYQKTQGRDVMFVTGTDEHGAKIAQEAQSAGKSPQNFVDEIAQSYIDTWKVLDIQYDDFTRTTSERHTKGVLSFIEKLYKSGSIYQDIYEGLYCVGCESFIDEKQLVNGLCPNHLQPPQKIKERNYFFDLEKYLPIIRQKIAGDEINIVPESCKNEMLDVVDSGIPNFSISREKVKWGIPFPYDPNQTIYVWVEALMNYLTILGFPDGTKYRKFWPADLHIIGADINKFHSIVWPGLLLAISAPLPETIFVHGFFTVDGQKMSKTLGNIVDPLEMVERFGPDATRYLILSQFSALEHGDIKASEFIAKYNTGLANGVGNLLERVFSMAVNYRNGAVGDNVGVDKSVASVMKTVETDYRQHMEKYRLFEALQDTFTLIRTLDKYITDKKPWELHKKQDSGLDIVLSSLLLGVEKVIEQLRPFMPTKIEAAHEYFQEVRSGGAKQGDERKKLNLFPRLKD